MDEQTRHQSNVPAARALRQRPTSSETLLWALLRDRRLHGRKFRRQHPVGSFVLDFFCRELNLAIEIDGPVHADQEQAKYDNERQVLLEQLGIQFLRVTAADVEAHPDEVLQRILSLTPGPSPRGRGE